MLNKYEAFYSENSHIFRKERKGDFLPVLEGEVLSLISMTTRIEKILVIVFLVVFSTLGVIGYSIRDAEPKKIVLQSQAGTVIFNHAAHLEYAECNSCHHTMTDKTEKPKPCRQCHNAQKSGSDVSPSDAFHGDCGECHDEVRDSQNCKMCHKITGKNH